MAVPFWKFCKNLLNNDDDDDYDYDYYYDDEEIDCLSIFGSYGPRKEVNKQLSVLRSIFNDEILKLYFTIEYWKFKDIVMENYPKHLSDKYSDIERHIFYQFTDYINFDRKKIKSEYEFRMFKSDIRKKLFSIE